MGIRCANTNAPVFIGNWAGLRVDKMAWGGFLGVRELRQASNRRADRMGKWSFLVNDLPDDQHVLG